MMRTATNLFGTACVGILALIANQSLRAQVPGTYVPTVQAYGEHILELQPQKIRLLMVAKAEGANAKEAVEQLAKHRQTVRDELIALKADRDSIGVAPAEIRSHTMGLPTQYQHMSNRMLSNFLDNSANIHIEDLPIVYTATCFVSADWTLPSTDADLLLQLPSTLREQITKRDLLGEENQLQLSPEQAARIEKFKAALDEHMGYYEEEDTETKLQIIYVGSVTTESRTQALKAAYERAREECNALAEASNRKLGALVSLSKVTPDESTNNFVFSDASVDGPDTLRARQARGTRRDEFTARHPDLLQARFQVRAIFSIP